MFSINGFEHFECQIHVHRGVVYTTLSAFLLNQSRNIEGISRRVLKDQSNQMQSGITLEDGVHQPPLAYHAACSDFAIEPASKKCRQFVSDLWGRWPRHMLKGFLRQLKIHQIWGWKGQHLCRLQSIQSLYIKANSMQIIFPLLPCWVSFESTLICRFPFMVMMSHSSKWVAGLSLSSMHFCSSAHPAPSQEVLQRSFLLCRVPRFAKATKVEFVEEICWIFKNVASCLRVRVSKEVPEPWRGFALAHLIHGAVVVSEPKLLWVLLQWPHSEIYFFTILCQGRFMQCYELCGSRNSRRFQVLQVLQMALLGSCFLIAPYRWFCISHYLIIRTLDVRFLHCVYLYKCGHVGWLWLTGGILEFCESALLHGARVTCADLKRLNKLQRWRYGVDAKRWQPKAFFLPPGVGEVVRDRNGELSWYLKLRNCGWDFTLVAKHVKNIWKTYWIKSFLVHLLDIDPLLDQINLFSWKERVSVPRSLPLAAVVPLAIWIS